VNERRRYLTLVLALVVALIGVALLAVPGSPVERKPTLGLDLQGGLEVILKAQPPRDRPNYKLTKDDLNRSVSIMRNRVDKLGVSEPEIRTQGSDQIVIELAGVHNAEAAAALIGKTAQLQFYDLEPDLAPPSTGAQGTIVPHTRLYNVLASVQALTKQGTPAEWYLFNKHKHKVAGPAPTRAKLLESRKGKVPKGFTVFAVPSDRIVITCGKNAVVCPGVQSAPARTYYYLFKYQPHNKQHPIPEMGGNDLKLSGTRADFDPQSNGPVVLMQFTGHGSKVFEQITAQEAQRGRALANLGTPDQNAYQHFAIVLDGEIASFPYIDFNQNPNGIGGGSAQITGLQSIGEAKRIALVLQTGALPVDFKTIERTDVSATLGKDSLKEAKLAAAIGLLLVMFFLLLFYRFLGVIAVIGLGVYAAFMYAAILLFHVTLTLPGFAGLILTIGVAADANVVIFERIKEEVRAGKSVRHAIATGYSKGFHTIIDANVVTAITAMVLFGVATAGVKGFALMLLIGIVISMVTAVAATRALLGLLGGFKWIESPRLMGAAGQQRGKWLQIDFMGKRWLWLAISGAVVLISAASLGIRGLNFGIDFKGGTQIIFTTPKPVSIDKVRAQTARIGERTAVVQGRGKTIGGGYENFQLRMRSLTSADQTKLTNDLKETLNADVRQVNNVSASFGRQIARGAILAIIVSLLLIVLYITIRFQFKFALPVIGALIHDIVITVGVYSLSAREVTTATVAAVLTVLGYSIYDTIIIFDRIRENIPLMRRASFATIANVSLWETIRRSLATSFITLLPVGALFLFGGATLKDFAFALLIGIASGAYSSIFIAAPLLTMWKEREPEYARRRESEVIEAGVGALLPEEQEPVEAPIAEGEPELAPAAPRVVDPTKAEARRQRRRQRRRTRPHGRAR
jgi:SecD/SecF fusion protein